MTSPPDDPKLSAARDLLRSRLALAGRAVVPGPPASRLLQRFGLEAAVEHRFCSESLAHLMPEEGPPPRSALVVDVSGTGRAATVWLGHALSLFAGRSPSTRVTLVLPATPPAGRGRLLERYLASDAVAQAGVETEVLSGLAPIGRSAPVGEAERAVIREAYELILVLSLGGSAGIEATWPAHPAQGWLQLADGAVLGFIDPDSLVGDLPRLVAVDPAPLRLRVETLEGDSPTLVGQVDLDGLEQAKAELPRLFEGARRRPYRVVAQPPPERDGTALGCPCETAARALVGPLSVRRTLVAGRLRLVSGWAEP